MTGLLRCARNVPKSIGTWLVALCLLQCAGCGRGKLDDTYGVRRGAKGGSSVNGTAVLAGMFEQAGHRVRSWHRLSPKLEEYDTIVWAPDSFTPPSLEERQFLERWLANGQFRTLVYIGRDYDATIDYWQKVLPNAPADQMLEVSRRSARARARYESDRAEIPKRELCDWFTLRRDGPPGNGHVLRGPWSEVIDGSKAEIQIRARLKRPNSEEREKWRKRKSDTWWRDVEARSLLATEEGVDLVSRLTRDDWFDGQLLVVANGSFLLNLPLVNHEHRKLASRLVASCQPESDAIFLESGPDGLGILDEEPNAKAPNGFEVLTQWPIGIIALHLIVLGITLCFVFFPVFGRPRDIQDALRSDFGRHVEALGILLELTRDNGYAADKIQYYQRHVKRDGATGRRGK